MPPTLDPDGALFERLRPRLTAISRRIVGSDAEAEDIVQDCFLKWRCADQDALETPAAWLTTVVRHQSIDLLRKRVRDAAAAHATLDWLPADAAPPPEHGLLRRAELGAALGRMLACLSPSERLALVLREVFECEHADIAAALGTTAVNARQHLARARRRLRERADEERDMDRAGAPSGDRLCRELVRRFQAALDGLDVPAMVSLLAAEQPLSVLAPARPRGGTRACANDAVYRVAVAA
ncbi:sigma-70 family RNA polymerase sigma factor [Massilia forsythiae]|uniref:Sigma-70 family RNA polymerase sigma factor n=1 Tax=Massilia forsythiae TaxID=2728020 RepID=A0A7Z2VY92_9BURK|nr:sigma-70 family RNA polymerase sigma factor [Massilia forsythiae]QJE01637.1 sigma-70 family RNA polymerase sigma factor [Massilia forsythiae]